MSRKSTKEKTQRPLLLRMIGLTIIIVSVIYGILTEVDDKQPDIVTPPDTGPAAPFTFSQGTGAEKGFWQVYFTGPTGSRDAATYTGGVDTAIIAAINAVTSTLDIAAFEWNNPALTDAVIAAHRRGVKVRMAVDDEHAMHDEDSTLDRVIAAGIPVIDDGRGGLMHNKFMIMDSQTVWTGSMNYTINGTYRNNNNALMLRSTEAIRAYQIEFNEMFEQREFGSKRSGVNSASFVQDGIRVKILFAPEDAVVDALLEIINGAQSSIRFMTFSFTLDDVGQAVLARARAGVSVEGVFEVTGSRTEYSELPLLFCAGLPVYQDGNSFVMHHKVFIIDGTIVATGSFNISESATNNNDENMVIIHDPVLAAQYLAEFERMKAQASVPPADAITCP